VAAVTIIGHKDCNRQAVHSRCVSVFMFPQIKRSIFCCWLARTPSQPSGSGDESRGPVHLQGWRNYDSRPDFRGPPTPLKSSLELPKFSLPSDTHHPLKTAGIRGFWPRYARLETTHPPKVGQQQPGSTPTHPPADSEVCNHNYTAPANEQGLAETETSENLERPAGLLILPGMAGRAARAGPLHAVY
jgi:hypothetical protein